MPEYRITYQTTVSASLTLTFDSDDEALTEEQSQALIEAHFNQAGFTFGAREYALTADATVDGMAPSEIARIEGPGNYVRIGGDA